MLAECAVVGMQHAGTEQRSACEAGLPLVAAQERGNASPPAAIRLPGRACNQVGSAAKLLEQARRCALVISDESEAHDLMASDRYSILLSIPFPK